MLDGQPFFTAARHGQFWLSVPNSTHGAVPCRNFVPKGLAKDKPVPIVVALHGHGGDENSFFEQYGAGRVVAECEKRGWVLIAPARGEGWEWAAGGRAGWETRRALSNRPQARVRGRALARSGSSAGSGGGGELPALALLDGNGMVGRRW